LLHEMVHQWQAETGRKLGHGREFRRMLDQVSRESPIVSRQSPVVSRCLAWRPPIGDWRLATHDPRIPTIFTRLSLES
jgi:hypothetical protein